METCRTCAKCDFENDENWLDLFHPTRLEMEIRNIRDEFINWNLEINQSDGLPQKICTDCFSKFCNVYTFRMECQEAQTKLNTIFDKVDPQAMDDYDNIGTVAGLLPNLITIEGTIKRRSDIQIANKIKIDSNLEGAFDIFVLPENENKVELHNSSTNNLSNSIDSSERSCLHDSAQSPERESLNSLLNEDSTFTAVNEYNSMNQANVILTSGPPRTPLIEETDLIEFVEEINDDSDQQSTIMEDLTLFIDSKGDHITNPSEPTKDINNEIKITFECKYCFKGNETPVNHYLTQQALLAHITSVHNTEQPYNCPQCFEGFRDTASRTVHIKNQHVEKHYNCDVCGKKYADRFNLRHHIEKYHSDTDFECPECEKTFYSRKSLNYHMKWHNPERQLKCGYCDRLFINQRHLSCHEATHTGIRNSEYCSFCGKSFIHLKTLRWHIYREHGGEKPYKCGNCSEAFASYLEKRLHMLDFHLENLTSNERTECMICHEHYENDVVLVNHMREDHQKSKSKTPIIANNKRVLQEKRQKHYSGIFQCEICSQRFNMKSALERHGAVHSVEGRPHACPLCSKRFKRVQDMNWHMKTHSNDKPNVCDVCGKGFALKYVLTQHKRSHEVLEKKFMCSICGRSYLFEKSLRVHERVHTGKTYYKCDLCSATFVTHIKFKCHMRKMHSPSTTTRKLPLDE